MSFINDYFLNTTEDVTIKPTSGNPLIWRNDLGIGYLRSDGYEYAEEYWDKYQEYGAGEIGKKLTLFRESFVSKHLDSFINLCDVGIGCGQFVKHVGCKGNDINRFAKEWLIKEKLFGDPYTTRFDALTFWDVLEHIEDPSPILGNTDKVFMSVPLHENLEACLASKHLRPNEHIWHFTPKGVEFFMQYHGFDIMDEDDGETRAGRESIMTYYFCKTINTA